MVDPLRDFLRRELEVHDDTAIPNQSKIFLIRNGPAPKRYDAFSASGDLDERRPFDGPERLLTVRGKNLFYLLAGFLFYELVEIHKFETKRVRQDRTDGTLPAPHEAGEIDETFFGMALFFHRSLENRQEQIRRGTARSEHFNTDAKAKIHSVHVNARPERRTGKKHKDSTGLRRRLCEFAFAGKFRIPEAHLRAHKKTGTNPIVEAGLHMNPVVHRSVSLGRLDSRDLQNPGPDIRAQTAAHRQPHMVRSEGNENLRAQFNGDKTESFVDRQTFRWRRKTHKLFLSTDLRKILSGERDRNGMT